MDLTPAWSHSHQSVQEEKGWAVWAERERQKNLLFFSLYLFMILPPCLFWINSYFIQTLISPGDDSILQTRQCLGNMQVTQPAASPTEP